MIIYIYLVFFHHCLKSKMAAGGHFENKILVTFFSMPQFDLGNFKLKKKKKKKFAIEKKKNCGGT